MGMFGDTPEIKLPRPDIHLPRLDIVPFWTDELKAGRAAYGRGDYGRARKLFLKSSDDGNMVADWYLGHMYRLGHGVPVDPAAAYSYFSRVADQFSSDEQDPFRLRIEVDAKIRAADYLRLGIPSAKLRANPQEAARTYLQMATSFGHPRAFYALGVMSIEGDGMRQNPTQGLKWLNAAIRKHSAEAAAYMGELCAKGGVVPQDDLKALTWYIVAAGAARQDEDPGIYDRLNDLKFAASQETRLEAEARARVWNEQNPGNPNQ
ncbi:tetratricopeptide repeat protein [Aestuariivirga litoralis]|uniref:tetratricopeptide repeat protein n=1 Tax=Aestuariivirga litoralis TaxID=2650924 RepID=UPI0018C6C94C|nr:tetratricopeptide repeat protein [Aestuariivirga litoralis]